MSRPDQYDLFGAVDDHDRRVFVRTDEKLTNAATFTVLKEDHTLGNLLRMQLHEDENVIFAGYRVPHPLKHQFDLQLRTTGRITPKQALRNSIRDLKRELDSIRDKLKEEVNRQQNPDNQMFLDM
ncbi:DNA-directed RNA polymerase RBP11-like dimerization domain-containing protein [Plasmodiophora brassicae]|uniref:DNA-directed RNA polymerase RBP11-like dimerisation domain-containing protein n=1 Tax=Plasmodiophora brassicae TaxID=37360 RepID=A0A0G4IT84_PLABS|nr:hypothetical protein PBRA_006589 [Plasmodiophora brassicae]SPQ95893.1 unnamed protein product [Plasmodiophora brassicae]